MPTPEDRAWKDYSRAFREETLPQLLSSEVFLAIYDASDGDARIQFATSLGLALIYDKPIILTVLPGVTLPSKLTAIADEVLTLDMNDPASQAEFVQAVRRITGRNESKDP